MRPRPDVSAASMRSLLEPSSITIVGASPNGTGRTVVENLRQGAFAGEVACVNPKYEEILGYPCYPSIDEVPFTSDAVLVAVARGRVVPALEAAATKGIRSAVVLAIGFAEADDEGRELQRRLVSVATAADMAVLGPNCQGMVNFVRPVSLYMDRVDAYRPGRVGLLAQSGSVVTALTNNRRGVRWSHAVSSGNEAVVDAAAVLEYYVASPEVDVICLFVESIRRPDKFFEQCDLAYEAGKPVIVMKTGRTLAAQQAAMAHSGALAVPDRLVDALLRRHRVSRVDSLEEMLETALAMQSKKRPAAGRIAALTASGGQIELVLDNLPSTGLTAEPFGADLRQRLEKVLPSFLQPKNPLDWWGVDNPDTAVLGMLKAIAEDDGVDVVVQVADFTVGPTGESHRAGTAITTSLALDKERPELFVVLDGVGGAADSCDVEQLLDDGVLVLSGFQTGLRALGHLVRLSEPLPPPAATAPLDGEASELLAHGGSDEVAFELLRIAGIETADSVVVASEEDAVAAAERLGFPVVAKVAGDGLAHKSDHGGVILSIDSSAALREAIGRLRRIDASRFLVQQQVTGGVEVFLGLQSEPDLGTFVMVGLGGIWTELIDDVQIRPVGLRKGEAEEMIRELRGFRLLTGARGSQPVDLEVLAGCIERMDALGSAVGPLIQSFDVNPLIMTGGRAVAVDAFLVRREAPATSQDRSSTPARR